MLRLLVGGFIVKKDTHFDTFLYQNRCPDMVAGMGFEPHDLRVMRTSVLALTSSILESKKQEFFVFADVLSMRGVGGGSTYCRNSVLRMNFNASIAPDIDLQQ